MELVGSRIESARRALPSGVHRFHCLIADFGRLIAKALGAFGDAVAELLAGSLIRVVSICFDIGHGNSSARTKRARPLSFHLCKGCARATTGIRVPTR
jgi:hypothetical protein